MIGRRSDRTVYSQTFIKKMRGGGGGPLTGT
jgi:hypothetical protein